jgi:hypothetical protein
MSRGTVLDQRLRFNSLRLSAVPGDNPGMSYGHNHSCKMRKRKSMKDLRREIEMLKAQNIGMRGIFSGILARSIFGRIKFALFKR